MLQLWEKETCLSELLEPGKQPGECPKFSSWRYSQELINARPVAHVPTLAHINYTAHTHEQLNKNLVTILLDSRASCSVLSKDHMSPPNIKPMACTKLVNADGRIITPCGTTTLTVTLGPFSTEHSFIVVEHLSVPAILVLREHRFILNFESGMYYRADSPDQVLPLHLTELRSCSTVTIDEDCPQAIPVKCNDKDQIHLEMPTDIHPELRPVVQEFEELLSKQLGQTNVTKDIIDTVEATPIKVPSRQIPFYYANITPNYKTWSWKESSAQAQAHGALQLCTCQRQLGR